MRWSIHFDVSDLPVKQNFFRRISQDQTIKQIELKLEIVGLFYSFSISREFNFHLHLCDLAAEC